MIPVSKKEAAPGSHIMKGLTWRGLDDRTAGIASTHASRCEFSHDTSSMVVKNFYNKQPGRFTQTQRLSLDSFEPWRVEVACVLGALPRRQHKLRTVLT